MEFIPVEHPTRGASADLRRQIHSHAARVAHARARRLRVANYTRQNEAIKENTQQEQTLVEPKVVTPITPSIVSTTIEHGPFASFVESLTLVEHFLFNHYVQVVRPHLNLNCPVMKNAGESQEYMRQNWMFLSSTDIDFLRGFLLAACRHLSIVNMDENYVQLAIQYKLGYVQSLRQDILANNEASKRVAVTKALVLTLDELMLSDLPMASRHVSAAVNIIESCGGHIALGLSEFVVFILNNCIRAKRLLDRHLILRCKDAFMKPDLTQAEIRMN
ncbi:hypothetical protein EDB81DRAFT_799406 [Dactylonectria macrodidyma]|uniref:Uncharacterized protein n=1 Tax=Dactylonectria macrodidyma TaxID=307937 RepID=A0A9P9EQ62_9HYPO|nr:hypothetical protein EDB81DRAFT_799406 [Dactylonectria macrodidyma]